MNRVLPRISMQSGRNRRIIISTPSIHPNVGQRGGISGRTILSSVGIKRGEIVRVREGNPEAERKAIEEAVRRKAEKEALEAKQRETERLGAERMTAKEERLADLLEAVQAVKPIADAMAEEKVEEETIPETISEEQPKKKGKRGQKGKKAKETAVGTAKQELL